MPAGHSGDFGRFAADNCADDAANRVADVILIHDEQRADGMACRLHHLHPVLYPLIAHILVREDYAAVKLLQPDRCYETPANLLRAVVYELLLRHIHGRFGVSHEDSVIHPTTLYSRYLLIPRAISLVP